MDWGSFCLEIFCKVKITEFPSLILPLFNSKVSEKTNSSNMLDWSENLIIAYEVPFCVFFSWILRIETANNHSIKTLSLLIFLYERILKSLKISRYWLSGWSEIKNPTV